MIGLDTNILLRAMLDDHPVQSPSAQRLLQSLDGARPGLVNMVVLMEFFWVLKSRYKLSRARLAGIIRDLLETEHLEFEALETVAKAVTIYAEGGADFADAVVAILNMEHGAEKTFTFDLDAAKAVPGMELLT